MIVGDAMEGLAVGRQLGGEVGLIVGARLGSAVGMALISRT